MENNDMKTMVAEQAGHVFTNNVSFLGDDRCYSEHRVQKLEVHPASMRSQKDEEDFFLGFALIKFVTETTYRERMCVRNAQLIYSLGRQSKDDAHANWFTITPENGVVTHDWVRLVLRNLYECNAITYDDVEKAAKRFGVKLPDFSFGESRHYYAGHTPPRPAADKGHKNKVEIGL